MMIMMMMMTMMMMMMMDLTIRATADPCFYSATQVKPDSDFVMVCLYFVQKELCPVSRVKYVNIQMSWLR